VGTMKKSGGSGTPDGGSVTLTISSEHAVSLLAALTQAIHTGGTKGKGMKKPK